MGPSPCGGGGNETVDVLAKEALGSGDVDVVVSMSKAEAKSLIWTVMVQRWQEQWNRDTKGGHIFQVQRKFREDGRKGQNIFTRLRVGHSQLNKSLILKGKHPTGNYDYCQETETVQHVLYCYSVSSIRRKERG